MLITSCHKVSCKSLSRFANNTKLLSTLLIGFIKATNRISDLKRLALLNGYWTIHHKGINRPPQWYSYLNIFDKSYTILTNYGHF